MARMAPHKVVLHSHELSYVDSGSGPVVLFIHGILGSQRQWAHLVDKMDDDHRVVVPGLFGHGESAKPLGDYSLIAHAATCATSSITSGSIGSRSWGIRSGVASRCSSSTCSPSWSIASYWSTAAAWDVR